MSDEQNPPPSALRLKPRLVPTAAPFPAPAPPAAAGSPTDSAPRAPVAGQPPSPPKINLKPRSEPNFPQPEVAPDVAKAETFGVAPPVYPAFVPPAQEAIGAPPPLEASAAPSPPPLFRASPPAAAEAPAVEPEIGKFKLKPKIPSPIAPSAPPPAGVPSTFAPPVAPSTAIPPVIPPLPGSNVPPPHVLMPPVKVPPPFPVMAQSTTAKPAPPVTAPQLKLKTAAVESLAPPPAVPDKKRGARSVLIGVVAVVAISAGTFFAWQRFMVKPAPPLASPPKATAPTPAATAATPQPAKPSADPAITPSETLNKLAHTPANAINKAQEAIAARRASSQTRVDLALAGEDAPDKPATPRSPAATKSAAPPTKSAGGVTTVAPGVTAAAELEAGSEASAAFRAFVANAKVSGVFQGTPARAFINGKLTRAGETADGALGVVFIGYDADRHQLLFKDRTGAIVARKY